MTKVRIGKEHSNETALSLRSRRNGTKFAAPLIAELLIKYQRLPRGFFWNTCLPVLVYRPFCKKTIFLMKIKRHYSLKIILFLFIDTYLFLFYCYCKIRFSQIRIAYKLAEAKKYSKRSPLEDVGT